MKVILLSIFVLIGIHNFKNLFEFLIKITKVTQPSLPETNNDKTEQQQPTETEESNVSPIENNPVDNTDSKESSRSIDSDTTLLLQFEGDAAAKLYQFLSPQLVVHADDNFTEKVGYSISCKKFLEGHRYQCASLLESQLGDVFNPEKNEAIGYDADIEEKALLITYPKDLSAYIYKFLNPSLENSTRDGAYFKQAMAIHCDYFPVSDQRNEEAYICGHLLLNSDGALVRQGINSDPIIGVGNGYVATNTGERISEDFSFDGLAPSPENIISIPPLSGHVKPLDAPDNLELSRFLP